MEFKLDKIPVASLCTALDTVAEQPVDIDFTLPDYCPDIEKLLRCIITPKVYNRVLSGGQLRVEGSTVVTVLYTDNEKGCVRACEQNVPFSASFTVKDVPDNYVVETSVKCEYANCRAMSRRKLSVHGAFSLYAKVYRACDTDIYTPRDIDDTEFLTKELTVSSLSSLNSAEFSAGDEIHTSGKPPVETILCSTVSAAVTDSKVIPDKLMLGGELKVKLLYLSDNGEKPETLDCVIPFSQVVDSDGLREDDALCVRTSVLSYEVRLKNDILADDPLVDVDCRLCVSVIAYRQSEVEAACDAYNTKYLCEPDKTSVNYAKSREKLSDSFMYKDSLSYDGVEIGEIVECEATVCPVSVSVSDGKLLLNAKLSIGALAYDTEKQAVYLERAVDISQELEQNIAADKISCESISLASLSYRIADANTVEFRCELRYCLLTEVAADVETVAAISIDDEKPVVKKNCALTLYYADAGESLWDIAKRYSTKLSAVKDENENVADVLEESVMLLIPSL